MPTSKQYDNFTSSVTGDLLDDTIAWIQDNLEPEEVFTDSKLTDWASVQNVETIFTDKQLSAWAEASGYTKT